MILECPDGTVCDSQDVQHYGLFTHSVLANILAGIKQ